MPVSLPYADAGVVSPPASPVHRVIEPESDWSLPDFGELWQFRDLLLTLAVRDIKVRYKQTALGVAWIVLQPLIGAIILAFIFGRVANLATSFLISFAGMVVWSSFSSALTRASAVMVANQQLVSKIFFPRILLPVAAMFSTLIDAGVMVAMLGFLMIVRHQAVSPWIWTMPLFLVMGLMLALGLGLILTSLAVRFRDVQYLLPVVTQILMFASPVAYTAANVGQRVPEYRTLFFLNPLVAILEGFRWSVLWGGSPHPGEPWVSYFPGVGWILYSLAVCLGLLFIGAMVFRRMERDFADVI
jgi:lipopolysaccharide transport system permease protein